MIYKDFIFRLSIMRVRWSSAFRNKFIAVIDDPDPNCPGVFQQATYLAAFTYDPGANESFEDWLDKVFGQIVKDTEGL